MQMLSKGDHLSYFEKLACLARRKIYSIHGAFDDVEDVYLAGFLRRIEIEDRRCYDHLLDLLRSRYLSSKASDLRLVTRRSILGYVRLTSGGKGGHLELAATAVNVSHRGLCFELPEKLVVGTFYEARIELLDPGEPLNCAGTIAWVRETLPGFFTVGMEFGAKK